MELAGQEFWEELTGDDTFYLKLVNYMQDAPEKYIQSFREAYTRALNRFVMKFTADFCKKDGSIDWERLVVYNSAKKVADVLGKFTSMITQISELSNTVASAVEEQASTISEIARTVAGVNQAASEISRNITESANGLSEVSKNIQTLRAGITDTSDGVGLIKESSNDISNLAEKLKSTVA